MIFLSDDKGIGVINSNFTLIRFFNSFPIDFSAPSSNEYNQNPHLSEPKDKILDTMTVEKAQKSHINRIAWIYTDSKLESCVNALPKLKDDVLAQKKNISITLLSLDSLSDYIPKNTQSYVSFVIFCYLAAPRPSDDPIHIWIETLNLSKVI